MFVNNQTLSVNKKQGRKTRASAWAKKAKAKVIDDIKNL